MRNGNPELVKPIFCRSDMRLFESATGVDEATLRNGSAGASVTLETSLAEGHGECRFVIEKKTGHGK